MRATKILPPGFYHINTLNLSTTRAALWLNLAAFLLLLLFGWLFAKSIIFIRADNPLPNGIGGLFTSLPGWGWSALLPTILFMIVLHELVHAFFFWIFTHDRPRFAITSAYAFAAAPQWFFPRDRYILVGISPFVLISIVFLLLMRLADPIILPYLFLIAIFNAAGSFGDIVVIVWVLKQPSNCLINDKGDIFSSFGIN